MHSQKSAYNLELTLYNYSSSGCVILHLQIQTTGDYAVV